MSFESNTDPTFEALDEIRKIMDKSTRFISLSGWSGIWAGIVALAGSFVAYGWLKDTDKFVGNAGEPSMGFFDPYTNRLIVLALLVFLIALIGGLYFTYMKARRSDQKLWNNASKQLVLHFFFPMLAGGIFSYVFIYYGISLFVVPTCLAFYGLALISGSRHTLSEIRYLGMLEVGLGCINLFYPEYGLYFWALGFGLLHIIYGAIVKNRYEN